MKSLFYILLVSFSFHVHGQNEQIDSLKAKIEIDKANNNFGKLFVAYSELTQEYIYVNDSANVVLSTLKMADASRSGGSHLEALNILDELEESGYQINASQQVYYCLIKGSVYFELNKVDNAISWAKKGLKVGFDNNVNVHNPLLYNLLGASFTVNDPDSALYFVKLSIDEYLRRKDTSGVALPYINLARLYTDKRDMKMAEKMVFNAIDFLDIEDEPVYRKLAYDFLARIYDETKNYKEAVLYLKLRDSVYYAINSNVIKFKIEQFQNSLKTEKTQNEKILLQGKVELAEYESKTKTTLLVLGFVLLVALSLLLLFVWKNAKARKEVNIIIAKKAAELEELNKFKNKVISVISHDMRSPLAQIITLHQAKQSGIQFSDTELKEMERSILASTKSGLLILDNLLKWANSQLDGLALRKESFNSQMMLTHILNQVSQMAKEKDIKVISNLAPVDVITDEGLFEIVMRNIFSNAIKFSPEGSSIWVATSLKESQFEIVVMDEGPGIDESVILKLRKGEPVKSKNGSLGEKGAGIGLSFSMEFAKKMGGNLACFRLPEKGTKVVFTIPLNEMV